MSKIPNRYLSLIIWGLIFAFYNVLVLVISNLEEANGIYWCAFTFAEIAFILVGVIIALTKVSNVKIFSNYLPVYLATACYFGISLLMNIIFMCANATDDVTGNLVPNIGLIVVYAAALIICHMGFSHVTAVSGEISAKRSELKVLAVTVGALQYKTADQEIKNRINKLKETIEFSDPMGVSQTVQAEEDIKTQIEIIKGLLDANAPAAETLSAIDDAINKVKTRNELLLAVK